MGMPTIQELYRNLEEYKLQRKRYKRNNDDKKKRSLSLKISNSFNDDKDEDELSEVEAEEDEDEMTLLSKKLQRILREEWNKERGKPCLKRKTKIEMKKEVLPTHQTLQILSQQFFLV